MVIVAGKLGRLNRNSRQCGSTEGQSASVAQIVVQWPMVSVMLLESATHCQGWPVRQYCAGSFVVPPSGALGLSRHAAPTASIPNGGRHVRR